MHVGLQGEEFSIPESMRVFKEDNNIINIAFKNHDIDMSRVTYLMTSWDTSRSSK